MPCPSWLEDLCFAANILENHYFRPLDKEKIERELLLTFFQGLKDKYSFVLKPKPRKSTFNDKEGYGGIGTRVVAREKRLIVKEVFGGTPAEAAGIRSGDVILSIDGVPVRPSRLTEDSGRIRGKPGTVVVISVNRKGVGRQDFRIKRRRIHADVARGKMLAGDIGYVTLDFFPLRAGEEVERAIRRLANCPLEGLVLDLRDNYGGKARGAVGVASLFLTKGIVFSQRGRIRKTHEVLKERGDVLEGAPLVVLVNGETASAAEIVAGALQDHRRALIVGTRTYGKGTTISFLGRGEGFSAAYTSFINFTPTGQPISAGISPDIMVPDPSPPYRKDPQLETALQYLLHRSAARGIDAHRLHAPSGLTARNGNVRNRRSTGHHVGAQESTASGMRRCRAEVMNRG